MEYVVQNKVATISLWNYMALIIHIIAFSMLYMRARKTDTLKVFFLVQLSMAIWLVGKVFKTVSPTADLRWAFIVVYYFGICLLEVSFLDFAILYAKERPMKKLYRYGIYTTGLIQFLVVLTNPFHYMFYSEYSFWGDDFGILFYVHVVINYLFILIGMYYCGGKFKKQVVYKNVYQRNLITMAILVPIIFNFIYLSGVLHKFFRMLGIQIFDITPIVFSWSLLVFVYATFRYEFFGLTPLMRHEIIERLDTPLLLLNHKGRVIYINQKLRDVINIDFKEELAKEYDLLAIDGKTIMHEDHHYLVKTRSLGSGINLKHVITFTEVTAYEALKTQLKEKTEELECANGKLEDQIEILKETSRLGARNFVARELHDILGHSLVVTMKLLEMSKLTYLKDKTLTAQTLNKAKDAVESGYVKMRDLLFERNKNMVYSSSLLERELTRMIRSIESGGLKIKFFNRGKRDELSEETFDVIRKVLMELTTNTMKHSEANQMVLSINYDESIKLQVIDNGIGCDEIVKGNGLKGIEERLKLIGGSVNFKSSLGDGFSALIEIV